MQGISFLDHPYLNIDSILGENSLPTSIEDWEYVLKNEPLVFNLRQSPWLNISFKLLLISGFILVIAFLLNKFKWQVVWQFLKRKNFTLESYHQFISVSPKKLFSIIFENISLFNRLIGLVLTAILIFKDYNLLDNNFISLALILAGVLWHELRQNIIYNNLSNIPLVALFFGKNNKIPILLHSFLIAITAWTIIQISNSNFNSSFIDFFGPIMSVAYFYLPWLTKLFRPVTVDRNELFIFWLAIAFGIYFISIVALLSGVSFSIFLNILSFGNLVIIPIWYYFIKKIQPEIKSHWPGLAEKVYAGESSRFIVGFIVLLGLTTISRILNLILLAEQFAIIGLYLLTVGIIVKIIESHQTKHNSPQTDAHDSTEKKFSAS